MLVSIFSRIEPYLKDKRSNYEITYRSGFTQDLAFIQIGSLRSLNITGAHLETKQWRRHIRYTSPCCFKFKLEFYRLKPCLWNWGI